MNVISKRLCQINQFREARTDIWTTGTINASGAKANRLWVVRNVLASGTIPTATRTILHGDQPYLMAQIMANVDGTDTSTSAIMRREYVERLKLTNTETAPAKITRYVIKARRNIPYLNCVDTATNANTIYGMMNLLLTGYTQNTSGLGNALEDGTSVTANATFKMDVVQSLFDNPLFCNAFKVLKVRTRIVPQGEHMTLTIKRRKPKLYRGSKWFVSRKSITGEAAAAWAVTKGQVFQVFAIIGTTAENPAAAATWTVGVAGARLLVENNITVEYTWMDDNTRTYGKNSGVAGFDSETAYVPRPISSVFNTNIVQGPTAPQTNANAATSYMLGKTYTAGAGVDTDADMPDIAA